MGFPILVRWYLYIESGPCDLRQDDVMAWKYFLPWWCPQMGTFSTLLALCEGKPPVTGGFHSQRLVMKSFDVFFDLRLNSWANNRYAVKLRRHHAHYDVTVMINNSLWWFKGESPDTSNFPTEGPVMQSFDVFFVRSLNMLLNKQSSCLWFDGAHVTLSVYM